MGNISKMVGFLLILLLVRVPAYAVVETAGAIAPAKTLADFQREYSSTKPVVAWHKYQEYKRLQLAPRPTLEVSRMRREPMIYNVFSGTKPIIKALKPPQAKNTGYTGFPSVSSGTKPVIAFLRRS